MWRKNPACRDYDYRLIDDRVRLIRSMRQRGDVYGLINTLRTGLVRNLGNITSARLFNQSFSGTKLLIEEYISQYVEAVLDLAALPPPVDGEEATTSLPQEWEDGEISGGNGGKEEEEGEPRAGTADLRDRRYAGGMATATISTQHKLDFIHNAKQGYGRSALILQGGAIFGLCHLGVVKALFLRGLLPRVIVGTATGAMMAALVGVHPEEDLLRILTGDGIDLSAFAGKGTEAVSHNRRVGQSMWSRWDTLVRRVQRFRKEGYFLDVKVLEECVRANVGDLTFEEAFSRSKRILNITVVTAGQEGIPTLLNYVTAPNVVCLFLSTTRKQLN
jgi:TAG lipase/lysophosphatidylethanolamine acyltransferase